MTTTERGFAYFDWISRDFFKYLADEPDKDHYKAPGSNQNVKVKKKFQKKAQEAYELCVKAIDAENTESVNDKWKKVYGKNFPSKQTLEESISKALKTWTDTEEFIEDFYPVDIRHSLTIDCEVHQAQGLRKSLLNMLSHGFGISNNRKLLFKIIAHDVQGNYEVRWKILNRGDVARSRDQIRGQIESPNEANYMRRESADFTGKHLVECYLVQQGVVVARDSIIVPIL